MRQSEAVELQVEPVPAAYRDGHWLPARDVKLAEKWSKDPLDLLPNEPVTRTITLTAQGLTASQLPEMQELLPDGFRQYPDQPELENRKTAGGITGVRQQKNAIIPARPGEYTLPEISLPWWSTETQALEYAVLPERRVQVTAAAPDAAIDAPLFPAPDLDAQVQEQAAPETEETTTGATDASPGISIWQWLTCLLAMAWLATLGYILKNRRNSQAESSPPHTENAREARKTLERPAGTMTRNGLKRPCCSGRECAHRDRLPPAWATWRNKSTKNWLPKSVTFHAGCTPAQRNLARRTAPAGFSGGRKDRPPLKQPRSAANWNRYTACNHPVSFRVPFVIPASRPSFSCPSVIPVPHPSFPRRRNPVKHMSRRDTLSPVSR